MRRRPPGSTRNDTRVPYTTLLRCLSYPQLLWIVPSACSRKGVPVFFEFTRAKKGVEWRAFLICPTVLYEVSLSIKSCYLHTLRCYPTQTHVDARGRMAARQPAPWGK